MADEAGKGRGRNRSHAALGLWFFASGEIWKGAQSLHLCSSHLGRQRITQLLPRLHRPLQRAHPDAAADEFARVQRPEGARHWGTIHPVPSIQTLALSGSAPMARA